MMKFLSTLLVLFLVVFIGAASILGAGESRNNAPRIQVNAILNNAAVLTINGKQQMLQKNALSAEGFKLTKIETDKITLLISGVSREFKLGVTITSSKSAAKGTLNVSIRRDSSGMFRSSGKINDYPVTFLVDTGATFVAISSKLADQIGIEYSRNGKPQLANTASGVVTAYKIVLNHVSIGELQLYLVDAVVIEGDFPIVPLLGMSFLQRVKMFDDGFLLTIEEKL